MRKTKTGELLGRRIRALRKSKGLTQEELGKASKVNYKFLGSLERGLQNPSTVTLEKIATALKVDLMELFRFQHEETDLAKLRKVIAHLIEDERLETLQLILKIVRAIK